jgi:hypothetical protein
MDLSIVVGIIVLGCSVLTMDIFLKPGEAVAREASLHGGGHALVVAMLAADGSVVPANPYLFDLSVSRVRTDMQANGSNGASDTCFHAVMMEPASDCSGAPVAVVVQRSAELLAHRSGSSRPRLQAEVLWLPIRSRYRG